jgi:CheY-like chemotaxis protein
MSRKLDGCSILIVEDEPLVAFSIADIVRSEGGSVIGPAATCNQALLAMAGHQLHGAILDIMLKGETVFSVADALLDQGVPFVFITGDFEPHVPERYKHAPIVHKPCGAQQLISTLTTVMPQDDFH